MKMIVKFLSIGLLAAISCAISTRLFGGETPEIRKLFSGTTCDVSTCVNDGDRCSCKYVGGSCAPWEAMCTKEYPHKSSTTGTCKKQKDGSFTCEYKQAARPTRVQTQPSTKPMTCEEKFKNCQAMTAAGQPMGISCENEYIKCQSQELNEEI